MCTHVYMYMCVCVCLREREKGRGQCECTQRHDQQVGGIRCKGNPRLLRNHLSHVFPESAKWSIKSQMTSMQRSATPSASNSSDHCTAHYQPVTWLRVLGFFCHPAPTFLTCSLSFLMAFSSLSLR